MSTVNTQSKPGAVEYGADQIRELEGAEHVRTRPAMYIEDRGENGLHQLLWEVVDNSVDEYLQNANDEVHVSIDTQRGIAVVSDRGRGIPVEVSEKTGRSALVSAYGRLMTGGKFGQKGSAYSTSAGLHGVGSKATNFLSTVFVATSYRKEHDKGYTVKFRKGILVEPEKPSKRFPGLSATSHVGYSGMVVKFQPDPEIFGDAKFDPERVAHVLTQTGYTCPGLLITLTVDGVQTLSVRNTGGMMALLEDRLKEAGAVAQHDPLLIQVQPTSELPGIELALCWANVPGEHVSSFVNTKYMPDGGTHVTGLRRAITNALLKHTKEKVEPSDLREGVFAAMHYKCTDPEFQGQTKSALRTRNADGNVSRVVTPQIEGLIATNEALRDAIVARAVELRKARSKFRDVQASLAKIAASSSSRVLLPTKLLACYDCDADEREIMFVEGDSAKGSCRLARDPYFQEVLSLKGKVPNAFRTSPQKLIQNTEIADIVAALGCGVDVLTVGDGCKPENARHARIFLLADADPDGAHIESLILAFLMRHMQPMIEAGRIFIVSSPLFIGKKGGKRVFGNTKQEIHRQLPGASITRLKGQGEANVDEIRDYAFNLEKRDVTQVTLDAFDVAWRLMDADPSDRKLLLGLDRRSKSIAGRINPMKFGSDVFNRVRSNLNTLSRQPADQEAGEDDGGVPLLDDLED